jgi:sarcosine oxidase subunit gamma
VAETLATLEEALRGQHFLAVNVSDARPYLHVHGRGRARSPRQALPGGFLGGGLHPRHVPPHPHGADPAAFWLDEGGTFYLICFRPVADYAFNLLKMSEFPGGEVGVYA